MNSVPFSLWMYILVVRQVLYAEAIGATANKQCVVMSHAVYPNI